MELSDKKGIQHIVLALAQLGLKEVVICPGSRDASLIISLNRHPNFNCTSIRDERSAAFFALGKAIEFNQPVALLCTSGSAALNFAPAISEAYYQRIPLIVLTADRPKSWTDQGDGQTINQTNVFQNFIRKSFEISGDALTKDELWTIERNISEGFHIATHLDKGPVHFNIPVSEPLYGITKEITQQVKTFQIEQPEITLSEDSRQKLSQTFCERQKVMILVGQNIYDYQSLQTELVQISKHSNVIVLTESTSNIHHPNFVENIDRCITNLNENQAGELIPELLITVGGAIVSKRIKKLLREHRPIQHWNIHPYDSMMDTYQSLTHAIPMEAIDFFRQLQIPESEIINSNYKEKWLQHSSQKLSQHQMFCARCDYSDFQVFDILIRSIPKQTHLHLSNSSPIRYAQLFDNSHLAYTYSNRGVSGIDGCTSTAVGAASASPEKNFLLITGDVAFHYDKNALWNEEKSENLKIIIINNSGGGIFKIIPGPNQIKEGETFQVTPMHTNAQKLAEHYKWNYLSADSSDSLKSALKTFFSTDTQRCILEIFTDSETNPQVLEAYWDKLS